MRPQAREIVVVQPHHAFPVVVLSLLSVILVSVLAFRLTVASGNANTVSGPVVPKNLLAASSAAPTGKLKGRQIAALLGFGLAARRLFARLGMGVKDILSGPRPLDIFIL